MGFIDDVPEGFPGTKQNLKPVPDSASKARYLSAEDFNHVLTALGDLRGHIRGDGPFYGFAPTADPLPDGVTSYVYLDEDGKLHVKHDGDDVLVGGGASVPVVHVDLKAAGVIENDPTKGAANVAIINALILAAKTADAPTCFVAQTGEIWIDKAGTNWSVLIQQCRRLSFVGQGRFSTTFVQAGTGTANDWFGWLIDRSEQIGFYDLGFRQGTIRVPSAGQHDHLMFVTNLGSSGEVTKQIYGNNLYFGKCLGDCLSFFGNTQTVDECHFSNLMIDGAGFVQQAWAPSTAYVLYEQVRNGGKAYTCITPGTSAASGGPSGVGSDITDGTAHWSGAPGSISHRFGARSGITFQRGYRNIRIEGVNITGVQNSGLDMESTGAGDLSSAHLSRWYIDNTNGNTSTAASFSGSTSHADPSYYSSLDDFTIYNGGVQVAETFNCRITNFRVISDQPFPQEPTTALLYIQANSDNDGLVLRNIGLHRLAGSGAGPVLVVQGSGRVDIADLTVDQETANPPVMVESQGLADLSLCDSRIRFSGSSPGSFDMINVLATNQNCDRVKFDRVAFVSETGTMMSAIRFNARAPRLMRNLSITRCMAKESSVAVGVIFSQEPGSLIDPNPIIQTCDFGTAEPYITVDESDNPIASIFPMIAGNRNSVYTLTGTIDPGTGAGAKAPPGTSYVWRDGNDTSLWFKQKYTSRSGWTEVTLGAPSVAPYDLPASSIEWANHIAVNLLDIHPDGAISAPSGSWKGDTASGDQAATIGALPLVASGAVTYSNAESGYAATALGIPDNGASAGFGTTDASLGNPATSSYLMLVIGRLTAVPAAGRSLFFVSDQNQIRIRNVSGAARAHILLVGNDVTPAVDLDTTAVKVWVVQVNETANTALFATEDFKATPSYSSASSTTKRFAVGGFDANSAPFRSLRVYKWEGAAAELTESQVRALVESFGASVAW